MIKYSPCGRKILLTSDPIYGKLYLINTFNGTLIETFEITGTLHSTCFSPDSNYLICSVNKNIRVIDIKTKNEVAKLLGHTNEVKVVECSSTMILIASGG